MHLGTCAMERDVDEARLGASGNSAGDQSPRRPTQAQLAQLLSAFGIKPRTILAAKEKRSHSKGITVSNLRRLGLRIVTA